MKKILMAVTEGNFGTVITPDVLAKVEALGDVVKVSDFGEDPAKTYLDAIRDAQPEIIITAWGSPLLTIEGYRAAPNLKYLCHCAGTVRGIVERDVIAAGLLVSNWGRTIARSIAEGALMMTLAALRRVPAYVRHIEGGGWRTDAITPSEGLFEQKVGLHGLGGIAQEYVRLVRPFHCTLSAYSPHCPDEVFERLGVSRETRLARLYSDNRVISVHASKTDETRHVVNADVLAGMQDGALLVNTARGALIDTEALVAELRTGRIWAALDVFEEEPLPETSPLRRMPNCMVMPHAAGPTTDRQKDMGRHALENLSRYVGGAQVTDVVTTEKYDLIT